MAAPRVKESNVVKKIRLAMQARGAWVRKSHGGPNAQGWPDLIGVYRGYPVFVEVKAPGKENTLTKLQAKTLEDLTAAGAIALVASNRETVMEVLDRIDQVRDRRASRAKKRAR